MNYRKYLFEFEDLPWLPNVIRDGVTECLELGANLSKVYQPAFEKILYVIKKTQSENIIDLCSGSGGPAKGLRNFLAEKHDSTIGIKLTDKYPNIEVFKKINQGPAGTLTASLESIDVTSVPANLTGVRTLFTAFHHFEPDKALKILQDAVDKQVPICIFEMTERSVLALLSMLFLPFITMLLIPFTRPITLSKLILTYLIPIIPLVNMWDGLVSCLRTYSEVQLQSFVGQLDRNNYHWEIGRMASGLNKVTYIIGYPKTCSVKQI